MLQQILKDMWVDPELLAELDDTQKQTLFCKMREEQVRRWTVWDREQTMKDETRTYACKKQVDFLLGTDGEPWVWVMGEHPDDPSIEEILEKEAREKARRQAEKEAEHLRKSMEAELSELLDLNQKQIEAMEAAQQKDEDMDIYCSVDELREKMKVQTETNNKINSLSDKRDILQEISLNMPKKVSQRVALWEKRVMEERTSEIFRRLQKKHMEVAREAEEAERKQDQLWREQERKAKEAEFQIREIARRAREEHRRTSVLDLEVEAQNNLSPNRNSDITLSPTLPTSVIDSQTAKPPSKEAVIEWFRSSEVARRAGMDPDSSKVAPWFHGLITRQEAEALLMESPVCSFLVRVSERIWGYAISYRDNDRCKHYLVDASNGHYQFLGANQLSHDTLGDLIAYHSKQPITALGRERLLHACPRSEIPSIFQGLLSPGIRW
ncbi:SH2 domain-containing protein 4A isoform X2 [Anabrus simplex]|uniref:SH2 domain-containing protein 4A isoform X2 n=1 Tax=Anabrus simplex TaxID=316456 RepID=UPI0035A266D3